MSTPRVSVVIPCYNNARYIGAAIESVLAQAEPDVEIIVVDDGSTDDLAEVVAGYEGITLISQDNQGVGVARNRGLAAAAGTYLALLDADDQWAPGKLTAQLAAFEADPTLDLVYAAIEEFVTDDLSAEERRTIEARPGRHGAMLPSTVLMTHHALDAIGDFVTGKRSGEALDWALRANEAGLTTTIAEGALVFRRIHATNSGRQIRETQTSEYLLALKRSLDRRRAAEGAGQ